MDADGDFDLLTDSKSNGRLRWFENSGDASSFKIGLREFETASHALMLDLDGNGTNDFVAPNKYTHHRIVDINGDGNDDILRVYSTGSWWAGAIAWYENLPRFGEGVFGPPVSVGYATSLSTVDYGDIDGDGDLDVVSAKFEGLSVHRNEDGKGTFQSALIVSRSGQLGATYHVQLADFDNDGDLDIVAGTDQLTIYDNDGSGQFTERVSLPSGGTLRTTGLGDVDNDGLLDIAVSRSTFSRKQLVWFRNTGESFETHEVATTSATVDEIFLQDLDGDGDLDVVTSSKEDASVRWYESDLIDNERVVGDASGDGESDLADFEILAANFGRQQAAYEQGDFDRNGVVNFLDFLIFAEAWAVTRS